MLAVGFTLLWSGTTNMWSKYDDSALPIEVPWAVVLHAEEKLPLYEAFPSETT